MDACHRSYTVGFPPVSSYCSILTRTTPKLLNLRSLVVVGHAGQHKLWLISNFIPTLKEAAYKKRLKDLQLPQPKLDTLNRSLTKALEWWQNQHDNAGAAISRVIVAMGKRK